MALIKVKDASISSASALLTVSAICTMVVVLIRAFVQSATIDECDSFLIFGYHSEPFQWLPSSGNHVLNTAIVRFFTYVFGLSHLTLRSSAMIGAAIFIFSARRLSLVVSDGRSVLGLSLFGCLVLNPFITDYLVAARGYSLALGFMMAALSLIVDEINDPGDVRNLRRRAALASLCIGLSFAASFPFAFVDGMVIVSFWILIIIRRRARWYEAVYICCIPGILIAFVIVGSTVLSWPKGQLSYGASTVREMYKSLVESSLYKPNPEILSPLLLPVFHYVGDWLAFAFAICAVCLAGSLAWIVIAHSGADLAPRVQTGLYLASVIGGSFLLYWSMHRVFKTLLPMDRTASFFVPLSTLFVAVLIDLKDRRAIPRVIAMASMGTLLIGCVYFLGCLRLSYFKEWRFNADSKEQFCIIQQLAQRYGIDNIVLGWEYKGVVGFYDAYYGHPSPLHYLDIAKAPQSGKVLYVLDQELHSDVLQQENPEIIYRSRITPLVMGIKIRP